MTTGPAVFKRLVLAVVLLFAAAPLAGGAAGADSRALTLDPERAIAHSQKAIGGVVGDYSFRDTRHRKVSLSRFRGQPVVVNLVYSACTQTCPVILQTLRDAVVVARDSLGAESFTVVTIGFDPARDSPENLRAFARSQGVAGIANWHFLSGRTETIEALLADVGFIANEAPQGFDHVAQTTILDSEGRVRAHVYGATFQPPALVEPLKAVMSDEADIASFEGLVERVRLFCTLYDPATGSYGFDYSFFIALAVGALCLIVLGTILLRVWLRMRRDARTLPMRSPRLSKSPSKEGT